jgi:hypothetical protein
MGDAVLVSQPALMLLRTLHSGLFMLCARFTAAL